MAAVTARRSGDLVLTGGASGTVRQQIGDIARALQSCGAGPGDLCAIRAFYKSGVVTEQALTREIVAEIGSAATIVLTLVPTGMPGLGDDLVSLEATAVAAHPGQIRRMAKGKHRDYCLANGIRRGRFVFTQAERAATTSDLASESRAVMEQQQLTLDILGASFVDIVRMNRWYHAPGTKDAWAPSALAVAAFYREPGPIATAISVPTFFDGGNAIQIELMGMLGEDGATLPKSHSWPAGHWDWPIHLPYKHGLACDGLAFIGGQVSLDAQADVIDPDSAGRQVIRSLANIDKVLDGFEGSTKRLIHLSAYFERGTDWTSDGSAREALTALAQTEPASVFAGFPNLSYPKMRVEIEAIAEII